MNNYKVDVFLYNSPISNGLLGSLGQFQSTLDGLKDGGYPYWRYLVNTYILSAYTPLGMRISRWKNKYNYLTLMTTNKEGVNELFGFILFVVEDNVCELLSGFLPDKEEMTKEFGPNIVSDIDEKFKNFKFDEIYYGDTSYNWCYPVTEIIYQDGTTTEIGDLS